MNHHGLGIGTISSDTIYLSLEKLSHASINICQVQALQERNLRKGLYPYYLHQEIFSACEDAFAICVLLLELHYHMKNKDDLFVSIVQKTYQEQLPIPQLLKQLLLKKNITVRKALN